MAMNWEILKNRYLQASRASQMESLGLNLIRLQALAVDGIEESVAYHLVRESQFFIEWSVPTISLETDMDFATELLSLQRQLSRWKLGWSELWNSESERGEIIQIAKHWGEKLQSQPKALTQQA